MAAPERLLLPAPAALRALSVYLLLVAAMNRYVPENYMDEPFHVPQTQLYCQGEFKAWDPKISTFPGLYIVGTAYAWLAWLLAGWWTGTPLEALCVGPYLRSLNALLSVACLALCYALATELRSVRQRTAAALAKRDGDTASEPQQHRQQQQQEEAEEQEDATDAAGAAGSRHSTGSAGGEASPLLLAITLALFPMHAFYSALYYTDMGGLAALLACQLALLRGRTGLAAAAGAAAVGFRQTNAVWVAFLLGARLLLDVQPQGSWQAQGKAPTLGQHSRSGSATTASKIRTAGGAPEQHHQKQRRQQQGKHVSPSELALHEEVALVLQCLWLRRWDMLARYWLVALVPLAFAVFVVLNGGVAVGDKAAHAPVVHPMQLHYMVLFIAAAGCLLLRAPQHAAAAASAVQHVPVRTAAALLAAAAVVAVTVAVGTVTHPYLLADNRHYTFYIWKRWFGVHWAARYLLVPAYVASWWLVLAALGQSTPRLWRVGFVAACAAALVPAGLVEFRYFTVPYMLTMLHAPPPTRTGALATAAAFLLINAATLYVFMLRPFKWPDGSTARFMW